LEDVLGTAGARAKCYDRAAAQNVTPPGDPAPKASVAAGCTAALRAGGRAVAISHRALRGIR
jgi:hypothetical protein